MKPDRHHNRDHCRPATAAEQVPFYASVHWIFLLLAVAVLGLSLVLTVQDQRAVVLPVVGVPLPGTCTFQRLAGVDCPGCGLTRCFISLARADLPAAWHYNPAGLLLFMLVLAQLPYRLAQIVRLRHNRPAWDPGIFGYGLLMLVALALIGQWLVRILGNTGQV